MVTFLPFSKICLDEESLGPLRVIFDVVLTRQQSAAQSFCRGWMHSIFTKPSPSMDAIWSNNVVIEKRWEPHETDGRGSFGSPEVRISCFLNQSPIDPLHCIRTRSNSIPRARSCSRPRTPLKIEQSFDSRYDSDSHYCTPTNSYCEAQSVNPYRPCLFVRWTTTLILRRLGLTRR